jgi:hypothetical protein
MEGVMAWTSADVDALERAIADGKGARTMQFGDQVVSFNSIDEMLKLLAIMRGGVAAAAGTSQRTRYAATSKGF